MPTNVTAKQAGTLHNRQVAAKRNNVPETADSADSETLVQRIAELEEEQEKAKARIEHLTQAKLSVEIALAKLRAQQEKNEHDRTNSERLQAELHTLLKRRDEEQAQLEEKLEDLKVRAKHDIALLKAERDAALALVERQQHQGTPIKDKNKWLEYITVSILTGILLFIVLLFVGI